MRVWVVWVGGGGWGGQGGVSVLAAVRACSQATVWAGWWGDGSGLRCSGCATVRRLALLQVLLRVRQPCLPAFMAGAVLS